MKVISFQSARKKLIILWLSMSVAVFLIFFIQSVNDKYTDHLKEVWQWVFQFITPAVTLMIGVLIAQGINRSGETDKAKVDIFFFRMAMGISLAFLITLFLSPIITPFIHVRQNLNLSMGEQKNILDSFKSFDNYLLPLQGITMLALGFFFL